MSRKEVALEMMFGDGVRPSLCIIGTGMEEGYGPYSSSHVWVADVLVEWECSTRFDMDVDGLISDVKSTEESEMVDLFMPMEGGMACCLIR